MLSLERKRKNPKSSTDGTTFTFPLLGRRRASFSRLTHTPPPMGSASWRKPPPRRSSRAPTSPPAAFSARPSGASGVPFSPREKESGRGEQSPQLLQTSSPDLPTPGGEILQPVSGWPPVLEARSPKSTSQQGHTPSETSRATKGSGQRHSCMPDVCRCQLRILTTLKNGGNGNTIRAAFENQTAKTLHQAICGLLVPQPGIEPTPSALEAQSLTTGPSGKSCPALFEFP
ncbi:PREDICTED: uncharacterized protein LOC104980394 isoform X2 [Bison bison bison]|uniref:Uncharacterized protein LOC104980394 isoform X2 n=2 Tax=Bovinae TaxID=27592 RepID=A0A6P3G6I7_BISBB|nr:PREDICTED: uncharacterized protein LOC104980394 isoform X2 [Bison bison bison]XP_010827389.1 PREDICTED: uncharacterized protein LOC104980394 isoform X2 [Bison bison bison]